MINDSSSLSYNENSPRKKVAVVLSGCGVYDGSEIQESVITLLSIDKLGADAVCFSIDKNQFHVVNHISGIEKKESRNMMEESARISRGNVEELKNFNPDEFDALVFVGGFGVAKNLSTFAFDGKDMKVEKDVQEAILKMYRKNRNIGFICISPMLAAKILGDESVTLTIGDDDSTAKNIESLGGKHKKSFGYEFVRDKNIFSTSAYMNAKSISEIEKGISSMLSEMLK